MKSALILTICLYILPGGFNQENAGTGIAQSLIECYNNTEILTRNLRLPSTINTLVSIIRKAENGNPSINARELSVQLLQRFRQDGIVGTDREEESSYAIPFSPKRYEAYKNRVQLKKLTTGSALTFNNDSLNILQRCSLHSMLSSTVERQERGDESTVCSKISRYTMRLHRSIEFSEKLSKTYSSCPIESAVVYSRWGAIKAGLILSGIASGFQYLLVPTNNGDSADNRYASTISGELAEAALYQASSSIILGTNGGTWNSTIVPKYYFIQDQQYLQVTDAEIRGGLDGLYLALNIDNFKSRFSNIKVSQIVDLYYSFRGVFNTSLRACNRKNLRTELITSEKLSTETTAFLYLLDEEAVLTHTVSPEYFPQLAQNSIDALNNYITSLNDLECSAEESTISRGYSDVIIILDSSWTYKVIQPVLSYILDNIDVNNFESTYSLYAGGNLNEIINSSASILDFYENYTLLEHQKYATGFDYNRVYQLIEDLGKNKIDNRSDIFGRSTTFLLVPKIAAQSSELELITTKLASFKLYLPDIRVLVLGSDSKDHYSSLVINPSSDIFVLSDSSDETTSKTIGKAVADRIKQIPRSVVNPNCGSNFQFDSTTFSVTQFVEPQSVNYHRISPNYFYTGNDDNRNLKVQGSNYGSIIVCLSRSDNYPKSNSSESNCKNMSSTEEVSFDLNGYCSDQTISDCQPIYLSVEAVSSNIKCSDVLCRFPDNIKYTITLENVGCASEGSHFVATFLLTIVLPLFFHIVIVI